MTKLRPRDTRARPQTFKIASVSVKQVKIPGPDHPITIKPTPGRVVVKVGGKVLVDTRGALTLQESSYPPVQYVPRGDTDMSLLVATEHETYCPYKGDCSYFSIPSGGSKATNAVWTYKQPFEAVDQIGEYLAFYPDRVDSIEVMA